MVVIRSKCKCGCGRYAKLGNEYLQWHHQRAKPLTDEHKEKISKGNKGKVRTEEFKRGVSLFHKGRRLTKEHKKAISRGNKGKVRTEEYKNKVSQVLKGYYKKGGVPWNKGKTNVYSEERLEELRRDYKCCLGEAPWNKGKKDIYSKKTLIKMSLAKIGEKSPTWNGGSSFDPYCISWTSKYRDFIKRRDNYECQNSDCEKKGGILHVHHIDYDKQNCDPSNLITLCNSCNSKANFNREYWKEKYQRVLESVNI